MKSIFDQTTLKNKKLKNRIFRSATWMAMADNNGHINDNIIQLYTKLAQSEIATIITGISSIYKEDQKIQSMLNFDDDTYIEEHKKLTKIIHENNSHILLQIAIIDIFTLHLDETINNLTKQEIKSIINLFGQAAHRAQKAGYDGVQIHAAHFFFLSKFISPLYNTRKDEYGGNNRKRSQIIIEIINEIKKVTTDDFIITIKINATDTIPGGIEINDAIEISQTISQTGIDAIEISANNTSHKNIKAGENEGYFTDYAKQIKDKINTPIILVGGHRSIENMNKILNTTNIEYLSLSRPLICEPNLIKRWKKGDTRASKCTSCNNCYSSKNHECIL